MKVLVIAPHCDDECLGMGGTILQYTGVQQVEVHIVYLTGNRERMAEAKDCCDILGATYEAWKQEDGNLKATALLSTRIAETAAIYDTVYCPNKYESHPDHVAAWALAKSAVAGKNLIYYEIWTPLRHPTTFVNITPYLSLKLAAIRAHKSQLINNFDEGILALNRYRGIMSGTHAFAMEAFRNGAD